MNITNQLHRETGIAENAIRKVLSLLAEGATIPFMARYRKEVTGGLDEVELLTIKDRHHFLMEFEKRKTSILNAIEEQGKLTDHLRGLIAQSTTLAQLEDLYLPYKQKRKTKGQKAIDNGLKPLAIFIQKEYKNSRIEERATSFVKGEIESVEEALAGAVNILAEWISEETHIRERMREQFEKFGTITSKLKKGKEQEAQKFKDYFNFTERTNRIAAHRVLALLRAEKEGLFSLKIEVDEERALQNIEYFTFRKYAKNDYTYLAVAEAYKRILQPNFESEIKKALKEKSDNESILIFAKNLKQLLLQSPLGGKNTLAIDPGFRTGCKVAVLNSNGDFVTSTAIFPHDPQNNKEASAEVLKALVKKHDISVLAIGDGTAGLETIQFCEALFAKNALQIFEVSEAGASVYSASAVAREEFPDLDITVRGAISIGRRLMDPLAELVKIDPKAIGVGQYQHDVNQPLLKEKLDEVVSLCVNHVGVDLNTASFPILTHISGLGPSLAKNIVNYRQEHGNFTSRKALLKVPKLGAKSFEQSAGFLRIEKATNPLDNTIIHPESYKLAKVLKEKLDAGLSETQVLENYQVEFGTETVKLILQELKKPTRDPREPLKSVERNVVSTISDLHSGLVLNGTVNNITKFGAFVNIGIKESGLVHVSEISNTFITDIHQVLQLGQRVKVRVLEVDLPRKRIQLTIKGV